MWLCVPVILLVSALQHSIYEIMPIGVVGVLAPVNESLAEHLKIVFYPTLLWFILTLAIFNKSCNLDYYKWLTAGGIAAIIAVGLLTSLFCTFIYGFNVPIDSFIFHMIIEIVSLSIAYLVGLHYYNRAKSCAAVTIIVAILVVAIGILMSVFSFYPPNITIFKS